MSLAAFLELRQDSRILGESSGFRFAHAKVYLANGKKKKFAVKKYDLESRLNKQVQDRAEEDETELIMAEVRHLKQFRHQNLLHLLGAFVSGTCIVLVFNHMNLGSVQSLLRNHFPAGLPEMAVAFILRDVLQALKYLHSRAVVHRSVRCSHILLSDDGVARLSGLKYACSLIETGAGVQDR